MNETDRALQDIEAALDTLHERLGVGTGIRPKTDPVRLLRIGSRLTEAMCRMAHCREYAEHLGHAVTPKRALAAADAFRKKIRAALGFQKDK